MAANIKGISIEFDGETTGLGKALADVNTKARSVQTELNQVNKLLKLDPSSTELVAQKQQLLKEAVANTAEKLDRLKAAQAQVQTQFDKGEITQEQFRAFQREIQKTEQDLQKLEAAGKKSMTEIGKGLDNAGQKMTSAGQSMTQNVTAPILAVGAAGVKLGMNLDEALDNIEIKTGATGKALAGLFSDFNAVAKKVPSDFEDISTALADLNVRLDLTGKPLQDMAEKVLNLSRLTGTDLSSNLELVGTAFKAFNVNASDYSNGIDLIFRTTQETGISLDELLGGMQEFGPVLSELGFGFNESAALLGTLKKNGADVEQTLGSLKKGFVTFAKEGVTDGKEALRLLLEQIKAAPTPLEAARLAVETFGAKAGASMGPNIKAGRLNIEELLATIEGGTGTINGTAAATDDWLEKLKILWNQIQVEIQPGIKKLWDSLNKMVPLIAKIAEKIAGLFTSFAKLPAGVQAGGIAFIAFMAALGPILMIVGVLVSSIGKIVSAFSAMSGAVSAAGGIMGVLTGPVGIAIAVIAALAAVGYLVYKNWNSIVTALQPVIAMFKTYVMPVLQEVWNIIKGSLLAALDNLKEAWKNLLPVLQPLLPYLKMIGVAFLIAIVAPIAIAIAAILAIIVVFSKLVQGITWVIAQVTYFGTHFKQVMSELWTHVSTIFTNLAIAAKQKVSELVEGVVGFITALPGRLAFGLGWLIGAGIKFFADFVTGAIAFISALPGQIIDFITNMVTTGAVLLSQFVESAVGFFSSLPGRAAEFMSSLISTVGNWLSQLPGQAQSAGSQLVEGLMGFIRSLPDKVSGIFSNVIDTVKGWASKLFEAARRIAADFWDGFKEGLGIHSPSYIERAFMAIGAQATLTLADVQGAVGGLNLSIGRLPFEVTRPAQSLMAEQRQPTTVFIQGQPASSNQGDINIAATVNNPADAVLMGRTIAFNQRTRGY